MSQWKPHAGPQERFLSCGATEALFGGKAGGGKRLALDTPIPTPTGWTTMGALRVGDVVFGRDGKQTNVTHAFEVVDETDAFEVLFDDGARIVADAEHRWLTFDAKERLQLLTLTPEWREARKVRRPSRATATGRRSENTAAMNAARAYATKPAPVGTVRTTATIAETIHVKGERINHAVPVAGALEAGDADLAIDPYLLGLWLGDGTTKAGSVTTADREVVDAFGAAFRPGFVTRGKTASTYGFHGLRQQLAAIGVLGRKHVPTTYLRASHAQRLALLRGLMDSDGHACAAGSVEFTTTSPLLARDVRELVVSLGSKVVAREGRATLKGRDCGPKWRLKWTPSDIVFLLERKAKRQKLATRPTTRMRYIVECRRIPSVPMRCISVDAADGLFLAGREMVPTHNSDCMLVGPLRFVDRPRFRAGLFRRTWPELQRSLFERAWEMYPQVGGRPVDGGRAWEWPSGATIELATMERPQDRYKFASAEYQHLGFDELMTFERVQYTFMWSRLRTSDPEIPLMMRAGTNPGGVGGAWIAERFAPWVYSPEDGKHPEEYRGPYAAPGERLYVVTDSKSLDVFVPKGTPRSYARTFFPASLDDNPSIDKEQYLAALQNLDPVTREQLEKGNWMARGGARSYFRREWFRIEDRAPHPNDIVAIVRYWDRAATEPSAENPDPDWSVGAKLALTRDGTIWVLDIAREQLGPGPLEDFMEGTADIDEPGTSLWFEHDPGQAGKAEMRHLLLRFQRFGAKPKEWGQASKLSRAKPFSAAVYNRQVVLLRADWNLKFILEAEDFDGLGKAHDDQIDACSGAFWALQVAKLGATSSASGSQQKRVSMHGTTSGAPQIVVGPNGFRVDRAARGGF